MEQTSHLVTGVKLLGDLLVYLRSQVKALLRFVVWQWRAKRTSSVIRSFYVSLRAQVGARVIIEKSVFLDNTSSVGDYTYINPYSSVENATIGKFCSIARGVMIGPADHDYSNVSTHPFWYQPFYGFDVRAASGQDHESKRTVISDDVWIGCNAVIRRGVSIQTGAVIGAGSLVTKDVGAYEIWGGIPAKKIKQRFDDVTIQGLMELNWCNLPISKINSDIVPNINDLGSAIGTAVSK